MNEQPALKHLWKKVFGDSDQWIERFFRYFYKTGSALFEEAGGLVVSGIHLIPLSCRRGGEAAAIFYFCGAATLPEARGEGRMARLIGRAQSAARAAGAAGIALIPAEPSLYNYYARFGFRAVYFHTSGRYTSSQEPFTEIIFDSETPADQLAVCQNRILSGEWSVLQTGRTLTFLREDLLSRRGELLGIRLNGRLIGYLAFCGQPEPFISELICPAEERSAVLSAFLARAGLTEIGWRGPCLLPEDEEYPAGMLWLADDKSPVDGGAGTPYINSLINY